MNTVIQYQKGFSAMTAVVLIVLFALLGTYMATLFNIGSLNTTQSRGTMQAWAAARSGVEWAVSTVLASSNNCEDAAFFPANFILAGGAASGFTIDISCTITTIDDDDDPAYNVFDFELIASKGNPGEISYLSRSINLSVADAE